MGDFLTEFEHYINFLENFYAIPSTKYQTLDAIITSPEYLRGADIIYYKIKPIFIQKIIDELNRKKIKFDHFKYNYRVIKTFNKIDYNSFYFYNDRNLMRQYILDGIEFAKTLNKFTPEELILCETLKNDVNGDIYEYIHTLRKNKFFDRYFFNTFMDSKYENDNMINYNLILISGEGHIIIILKNNFTREIILFDPSYNRLYSNKYSCLMDIFGHEYTRKYIEIDVQNVPSLYQDIFCIFWCYHFVYWILINKITPEIYQSMFEATNTQRYVYEIKMFILKMIRSEEVYKENKNIYWMKYLKYKQKYLELKKLT